MRKKLLILPAIFSTLFIVYSLFMSASAFAATCTSACQGYTYYLYSGATGVESDMDVKHFHAANSSQKFMAYDLLSDFGSGQGVKVGYQLNWCGTSGVESYFWASNSAGTGWTYHCLTTAIPSGDYGSGVLHVQIEKTLLPTAWAVTERNSNSATNPGGCDGGSTCRPAFTMTPDEPTSELDFIGTNSSTTYSDNIHWTNNYYFDTFPSAQPFTDDGNLNGSYGNPVIATYATWPPVSGGTGGDFEGCVVTGTQTTCP